MLKMKKRMKQFSEYKQLDLSEINKDILKFWKNNNIFEKSIKTRKEHADFVFYEGPPSANGTPGIHHVVARAIKDMFCRYKTLQGFKVERKAGWDTHGLPVEIGVEKKLNIKKDEIGSKISVKEYNAHCRKDVMKYTGEWEELTDQMGYWVDMNNPYVTYDNKYIETLWYLLKQFYSKELLYKGYSIQPYSPSAGTGLSTHELNQPGCYRNVKDTTVVAQFEVVQNEQSNFLFKNVESELFFLAWTTTPWTLLSNTALAVNKNISYIKVKTYNQYTGLPITVILAKDRFNFYFNLKDEGLPIDSYEAGSKHIPYLILEEFQGQELVDCRYKQLFPYHQPKEGDAFRVVHGDFVTTDEGTGIVHIAPSFGADDFMVAKKNGIGSLTLVNKKGQFIEGVGEFSGRYVKNAYNENIEDGATTVDIDIAVKLKQENRNFKTEKYEHSYPHCWRTDKPILYYPLDSWFIKTTACKKRMIALNKTINWKPKSTGEGRFGQWLENLQDWNLSRSRYWGTPLPIWVSEDKKEQICIGSVAELKAEIEKSVATGLMHKNPIEHFTVGDFSKDNYDKIDLHRPFVDDIVLVSPSGKKMFREPDLIDVWFDSGAMPYAQVHYPFENKESFHHAFPADFIAEGVDQTRGWFFTLHAIASMLFDSVSFKNIISNGLVLDKNGNKMSKRLGNAVNPFEMLDKYGADNVRWYMITNSQPWDNLKFDEGGLEETKRKFFGTLYNTYSFFALYANIDGFRLEEEKIQINERKEIDRWILSLLNSLIKEVYEAMESYEPTRAARAIQTFVIDNLSNWYVRLNRKRFWGGSYNKDKIAAYQTLYEALEKVAILMSPMAPFYAEQLFKDLNFVTNQYSEESVHLAMFPKHNNTLINKPLEEKMDLAQKITSMVLALRRKVNIKVRQPLSKILIPVLNKKQAQYIADMQEIILSETNIKTIELVDDTSQIVVKKIKPNFKILGPKYGKFMKGINAFFSTMNQETIYHFEQNGKIKFDVMGKTIDITISEVEIVSEDIPGWLVEHDGNITIALDTKISQELKSEGIARELINKIQNMRKDSNFEVTDKIEIFIENEKLIKQAIESHYDYISSQVLAKKIIFVDNIEQNTGNLVKINDEIEITISITKN